MKKTVVFGGTFDPPHRGHKNLLVSVMSKGYDSALVVPAAVPPHKSRENGKEDFERRLALARKTFEKIPNVTVSDVEGRLSGKSYTVRTLEVLREENPDSELYFLMGSDMLLSIEKWFRFRQILEKTPIICAARTHEDKEKIKEFKKYLELNYKCNIIIYDIDVIDISSTELRSPLVQRIDAHNKKYLTADRYAHVCSVADYSAFLAGLHGIDPFSAYVAGLAHDCTKYMGSEQNLEYFEKNGITLTDDELECSKIYHQISGALFAKQTFGIENEDILNAIRYHTTGREGMSPLEKLVCLADSIEPVRDFEGVEQMRDMAKKDLDRALLMSFDRLIEYIKQRGLKMNPLTVKARDWLKGQING